MQINSLTVASGAVYYVSVNNDANKCFRCSSTNCNCKIIITVHPTLDKKNLCFLLLSSNYTITFLIFLSHFCILFVHFSFHLEKKNVLIDASCVHVAYCVYCFSNTDKICLNWMHTNRQLQWLTKSTANRFEVSITKKQHAIFLETKPLLL